MKMQDIIKEENSIKFYTKDGKGKITIGHYKLINFLAQNGFGRIKFNGGAEKLVKVEDNIIREVDRSDLINFIKQYLIDNKELDVLEVFAKGVSSYLISGKTAMLPEIKDVFDKDPKDEAWFYFKNKAVKITASKVELVPYEKLSHKIWGERILDRDYIQNLGSKGQFEDFIDKLCNSDKDRAFALKTALGYLLHRYNNPALCKAIIFVDENISADGTANGGSGKSLLLTAISKCKEVVVIDGKSTKAASRFKNQRVTNTTDVINYDDVVKCFSLVEIFSMLTSGIVIEEKGKKEIHLKPQEAPKIAITSNYVVKGLGGSSDERRRYEFEVDNFFNAKNTPLSHYGNLFFEGWDPDEWNRFDSSMIECVQEFLKNGLVEPKSLNLYKHKLISETSPEFYEFSEQNKFITDSWVCKNSVREKFTSSYHEIEDITAHKFTKWVKVYASINGLEYESKKSRDKYTFCLKSKDRKEVSDVK